MKKPGSLTYDICSKYVDEIVTVSDFKTGELTQKLYDFLTGIQWGKIEDTFGWTLPID